MIVGCKNDENNSGKLARLQINGLKNQHILGSL